MVGSASRALWLGPMIVRLRVIAWARRVLLWLKVGLHRAREDAADALQFVDEQNRPVPRSRMHAAPTVSSPAMMIGFRSRTIYPRGRFVMVRAISSSVPVINDTDQLTRVLHRSGVGS
jgi:hypothetical protein